MCDEEPAQQGNVAHCRILLTIPALHMLVALLSLLTLDVDIMFVLMTSWLSSYHGWPRGSKLWHYLFTTPWSFALCECRSPVRH
jgi:hypothetical protein